MSSHPFVSFRPHVVVSFSSSCPHRKKKITHHGDGFNGLSERPLRTPLNKLVHQQSQVSQNKATHEKREELRCMPDAQLEADVRLRRVLEARIFDLASDLVCGKDISLADVLSEAFYACWFVLVLMKWH
jgi:hypothetical protein